MKNRKLNDALNEKAYYRLRDTVIDNDFYLLQKQLVFMHGQLKKGDDFDMKAWDRIKKSIKDIEKTIMKHKG